MNLGCSLFIQVIFIILHKIMGELYCENDQNFRQMSLGLCSDLLMGQYLCDDPEIDIDTQSEKGCDNSRKVAVGCRPAPMIICVPDKRINPDGNPCNFTGNEIGFYKSVPCRWTNGYNFETSLLLSVFLGMFGIDRFYLGYPAIGLLKFSTLGFFFLGQLVDVLLIATQTVGPSDGSDYVIDYYGAGLIRTVMNNETIINTEALP